MASVDLGEVLSTCIDAARQAGAVIREVHRGGNLGTEYKIAGDAKSALTVADTRAQGLILDSLVREWPGIAFVGEEDVEPSPANGRPLRRDLLRAAAAAAAVGPVPERWRRVPLGDVLLFVDPVDGTREFVEGRLAAVQTLIGVAVRGEAVAGVMGLPFHGADGDAVYGMVGWGAVGTRPPERRDGGSVLTASAENNDPVLARVRQVIGADRTLPAGGTGNKILQLLWGKADIQLGNLGTSLWDTCATGAILEATGGRITDLFGDRFVYTKASRVRNIYGILATIAGVEKVYGGRRHDDITAAIRRSGAMEPVLAKHAAAAPKPKL